MGRLRKDGPVARAEGCVFCSIVAGEMEAGRVHEDDVSVSFLDRRPLFKGHTLLVPRRHVEVLAELPPDDVGPFFHVAQRLSAAMESALGAAGSFVAVNNRISQSVPHLHVHVVPRNRKDGLRGFFWPRSTYVDDEEMGAYASRLREAMS